MRKMFEDFDAESARTIPDLLEEIDKLKAEQADLLARQQAPWVWSGTTIPWTTSGTITTVYPLPDLSAYDGPNYSGYRVINPNTALSGFSTQ